MRYRKEIEVTSTAADAFAYIADFARTPEWDPGIAEARRLSDGPTALGSRFEVIALFRGNRQRFEYVVTAFDEGRRIVLRGEGARARSDDEITVETRDGRTCITYEADLRLKGAYRVAEPFLGSTFTRMGDDALAGLKTQLDRAA
jgi:carbon monoxide dehydrogenase subunit G